MYNIKNDDLGAYVCNAKCPELDSEKLSHCSFTVNNNYELSELLNKECACGNVSNWEKL